MLLTEKEIFIPHAANNESLLDHFAESVGKQLSAEDMPIRFAVSRTKESGYDCEIATLNGVKMKRNAEDIFAFRQRNFVNSNSFNVALVVPTGIGASLGGHSGDAGPVARLLAGVCDTLVTHPNVVNGADINELPDNALYVEGSVVSRLLAGTVGLRPTRSNRLILVIDDHQDSFFTSAAINSVSAARATMGLDCPLVVKMKNQILMRALYASSGRAVGRIEHLERLLAVLHQYRDEYDAVAISSRIQVPERFHADYFLDELDMVNPWGGVEAMLTHAVSHLLNVPSAHSPMLDSQEILELDVGVVDPRKSAEAVSTTFLQCILKGLQRSPRIVDLNSAEMTPDVLTAADIDCLVIPVECLGLPTLAALQQGMTVVAVAGNENCLHNDIRTLPFQPGKLHVVSSYLEATGVVSALRSGIAIDSVRRPLQPTRVVSWPKSREVDDQSPQELIGKAEPE